MAEVQIWRVIPEFPEYEVSNYGLIFSQHRRSTLTPTRNNYGYARIALTNEHGRFTRSVALLVAQAFVPATDTLSDTVVHLDDNKMNLNASNLVWRPRGFAFEYVRQIRNTPYPLHYVNLTVANEQTRVEYPNIVTAGMTEGLLFKDVWRSTHSGSPCYPSGNSYIVTQRV